MNTHIIGEISLTLSTLLYFIWFIPQLKLTFKRKNTSGLSLAMHCILMLGYLADLMYGFGQQLPIQYRLVTIVGLISLLIEHYQFGCYGLTNIKEKNRFILISVLLFCLFITILYNITIKTDSKMIYNLAGVSSMLCWLVFASPQILKNYKNNSTKGLSTQFVMLSVLTGILDVISSYALNWAWPSKLGAPLGLIQKFILLSQCYYYRGQLECQNVAG